MHDSQPSSSDAMSRDRVVPMDTSDDSVVCKNSVSSGNVVYLHPLVAMNIADHATRYKINGKDHQYGKWSLVLAPIIGHSLILEQSETTSHIVSI